MPSGNLIRIAADTGNYKKCSVNVIIHVLTGDVTRGECGDKLSRTRIMKETEIFSREHLAED